jgi:hypothetical protein
MIALVSFMVCGRYPDVGTTSRTVWKDLKTRRGINRRADTFQRPYRVELFHDGKFYGQPFETYYRGEIYAVEVDV